MDYKLPRVLELVFGSQRIKKHRVSHLLEFQFSVCDFRQLDLVYVNFILGTIFKEF